MISLMGKIWYTVSISLEIKEPLVDPSETILERYSCDCVNNKVVVF